MLLLIFSFRFRFHFRLTLSTFILNGNNSRYLSDIQPAYALYRRQISIEWAIYSLDRSTNSQYPFGIFKHCIVWHSLYCSVYPIVFSDIHFTALFTSLYCLTFTLLLCLPHCIVWHSLYCSVYLILLSDIHFTALFNSLYCLTFILLLCLTHCIVWHSFYCSV
jgi:hypothetical protein